MDFTLRGTPVSLILGYVKSILSAHMAQRRLSPHKDEREKYVGWIAPAPSWIKLNIDEASKGNLGPSSVGGLLHNESGN